MHVANLSIISGILFGPQSLPGGSFLEQVWAPLVCSVLRELNVQQTVVSGQTPQCPPNTLTQARSLSAWATCSPEGLSFGGLDEKRFFWRGGREQQTRQDERPDATSLLIQNWALQFSFLEYHGPGGP